MAGEFYVYVHRRPDTGMPFYVGKGKGARAKVLRQRNPYWRAIVEKHGEPAVEFRVQLLDEELALLTEVELIDQLRRVGVPLANLTDGGEGIAGYRRSRESIERGASKCRGRQQPAISAALKGRPKTQEHRAKLAESRRGRSASHETRAKMSEVRRGKPSPMFGKKHSAESKDKASRAQIGQKNHFFGRTHTPEAVEKIRAANVGRFESDATRLKKSISRQGPANPRFGVKLTNDQIQRQRTSLLASIASNRITCPHCLRDVDQANAHRWHLDRCKEKR